MLAGLFSALFDSVSFLLICATAGKCSVRPWPALPPAARTSGAINRLALRLRLPVRLITFSSSVARQLRGAGPAGGGGAGGGRAGGAGGGRAGGSRRAAGPGGRPGDRASASGPAGK